MAVLDRFRLDGKRAFVTGGSRGLGREMALALAEAGADLILVGRDRPALEAPPPTWSGAGGRPSSSRRTSASRSRRSERAARRLERHGPVHILVNNVGGRRIDAPTEDLDLEQWQEIIDLNLTSTFICTKLIGGAMVRRGQGGRVINVASVSGLVASRGARRAELRDEQGGGDPFHARGGSRLGAPSRHGERDRPGHLPHGAERPLEPAQSGRRGRVSARRSRSESSAARRTWLPSPSTWRATPRAT